jgi:hypothetical protein
MSASASLGLYGAETAVGGSQGAVSCPPLGLRPRGVAWLSERFTGGCLRVVARSRFFTSSAYENGASVMDEAQSGYGRLPEISGNWADGIDKSRARLQLAATEEPGKIVMRSTGDEQAVLLTTPVQVQLLADSIREGRFDHVIKQQP